MKRAIPVIVILLELLSIKPTFASLLVVKNEGEIVWNVLAEEDNLSLDVPKHSYLEVTKIAQVNPSESSLVVLKRQDGKISLSVDSGDEKKQLDVTNWKEDVIEVEERAEVKKLVIKIVDEKFRLEQNGISAITEFPVTIDSKSARLSIETSGGQTFLSIFPKEAVDSLLRAKFVNKIPDSNIELIEKDKELQYVIAGEKVFDILGLMEYSVPVTTFISASTGEILSIDSPTWFKYIKFLFV